MSEFTRTTLTPDEWAERAKALGQRLRDRELLLLEQQEVKEQHRTALRQLDGEIRRLSEAVRTGVEDRERQIGLFP
jgi:hypothetical protein